MEYHRCRDKHRQSTQRASLSVSDASTGVWPTKFEFTLELIFHQGLGLQCFPPVELEFHHCLFVVKHGWKHIKRGL